VTERTDEIKADLAELTAMQAQAQSLKESLQANDQED
jgi:hypothetical protein